MDIRTAEYDHVKPWADKGRTVRENGAALCPHCHKLKTHNERLKKTDKKRIKSTKGILTKSAEYNPFWLK